MNQTREEQAQPLECDRWRIAGIHMVLAALVFGIYAYVLECGFINVDDPGYVYANPLVNEGLSWSRVGEAFTTFLGSLWIPLTWLSFMFDVSLFGMNPAAFHLENVLWHAATSCLLFQLLYRATNRLYPSAIVAALFGVHPINVESVAWITERKNVLCAFFVVLSLFAYTGYVREKRWRNYACAVLFHGLALMAKPMAVTLPGMLLLWDLWPLGRDVRDWRRLVAEKLPFILLSGAASALALRAPVGNEAWVTSTTLDWASRASNAFVSYGAYLRDLAWPTHLAAFYPHPIDPQPLLAGSILTLLLAATILATRSYRGAPYLLVGSLWFLGALVPMLGLIQVGSQARGDRFTYLAQIGIFIAVVWWIADRVPKHRRALAGAIAALVIAGFAAQTVAEVQYWTNSVTVFERAIEQTGPNAFARVMAGRGRASMGDLEKAAEHFKMAVRTQPHLSGTWHDLGNVLTTLGSHEHAAQAYAVAARQEPDNPRYRASLVQARASLSERPQSVTPES